MIQFDFDWSDTLSLVLLVVVIALLPLQLWLLFRNNVRLSGSRNVLKVALNVLLWFSLLAFVLQPYFNRPVQSLTGIIAGKEVPYEVSRSLTDSLPNTELIAPKLLRNKVLDTLVLLGQEIPEVIFSDLQQSGRHPFVKWIPYFKPDQLRQLSWKGVLNKGEMQVFRGSVESSKKQVLKVSFGANALDSVVLNPGINDFKLSFPAFAEGRTAVVLHLANTTVDTLRFFARKADPLTVRFILDSPDFESRNLASWLGKNGNSVTYDARISKDLTASVRINNAAAPDLFITSPDNAKNAAIKKAVANGASVLFMGFQDPSSEMQLINAELGTRFQVRRVSNESAINISNTLSALPYSFALSGNQLQIPDYPVAVEKRGGKVAVSLLNETFPMQLAGDSVGYQKIWHKILAYLRPPQESNVNIVAPVIAGAKSHIEISNSKRNKLVNWGSDSLFTTGSPFNEKTKNGIFIPSTVGWVALEDSLNTEVLVEKSSDYVKTAQVRDFVAAYERQLSGLERTKGKIKSIHTRLPDWFWFTLILICFTALWVEAKFS
ncbi:hypothetical protein [Dyadobacter sp. CY343]|uniref:hypothetical protein n=1 Tax=Dyadobacter sp. CY343 TaxID=2907299 RepID=UPI001F3104D2|nr:hypothetical protein [Dyadobacter sp. CY343]MCE7062012.1 hypothetical protein [Dyadobacter sp. CY343]